MITKLFNIHLLVYEKKITTENCIPIYGWIIKNVIDKKNLNAWKF